MARKDPFKRISVSDRILEALEERRKAEHKGDYKIPPMNAYCERILWDYAQGKLIRGESNPAVSSPAPTVGASGIVQSPDLSASGSDKEKRYYRNARKKAR